MGSVKVEKFGGMLPAWDARFLPEDQADFSKNAYLYSGALQGWRVPKLLRNLTNSAAKYAFRVPIISQGVASASLTLVGNPLPGDTVTIGEITYKFVTAPVNPFDVLIGATIAKSAQALFLAVTDGGYDNNVVGAYTQVNPAVASVNPYAGNPFALQGSNNTQPANSIVLVPFTPSGTMLLNSINAVPAATNGVAKFKGVVYSDVYTLNATATAYVHIPTSLLATGGEVVGCTSGVTLTSTLPVPITLQEGTTYWFGFILDSAVPLSLQSNSQTGVSNSNIYSNGAPNPFQVSNISGSTTSGTSVGTLQTAYNINQPNWQIWGVTTTLNSTDAFNTIVGNVISFQAPAFGFSFNSTPVADSTNGARLSWGGKTTFTGGSNQTADTTITGASAWLEFIDQDTNVVRSPVVNDIYQRYYIASPSAPPRYNTSDRISRGLPPWYLGVPAPPITPVVSTATNSGGNPTQIGFPGSTTSGTYSTTGNDTLVLYPVITTVDVVLNDISTMITSVGASGSFSFTGFLFANVQPTVAQPIPPNAPGDFIAAGSPVNTGNQFSGPTAFVSTFVTPPTLSANTQYWIGIWWSSTGGSATFALADVKTQGYMAHGAPTLVFPTDTTTGIEAAPSMTANFVDLQLWGDLGTAATSAQEETRAYVYTWVTAYGEEGPPSPPALFTAYDNATWTVGMQPPLPEDMGTLRNIVSTNIYRTMSSQQGGTVFFFVGSLAATATTFVDNVTDDVVATNLILPSTNWFGPPATLQGMVSMPNGMVAGFRGNEVWFCEPFRPHAWPSGYVMTTDYPIVGLGVVGTTLVACTESNPQTFTGVNPSVMTQERIPLPEPCISRGGVLSADTGVYYPSVNGMIKVTATAAQNITQAWITREKWNKYAPQKFLRAVKNVSSYFAFGTTGVTNGIADNSVAQQGFTMELSEIADRQSFTLWPQVGGHRIGFNTLSSPLGVNIDNVLLDPWSGVALLVGGGAVYYYDFTDQAPNITPYVWRSKKFQGPHKENFAALRVWFDIPSGVAGYPPVTRTEVPFANPPVTAAVIKFVPGMFGVVRVIADGFYVTERELRSSTELMQVSAQQKYTTWQLEFEGVVIITNVKMATSVKELGKFK